MITRRRFPALVAAACTLFPLGTALGADTAPDSANSRASVPIQSNPLGENAALRYWIAFAQLPMLTPEQQKLIESPWKTPIDDDVRKLLASADSSLRYLNYGTRMPQCDWGSPKEEGFALLLPHLAKGRGLGRLALLRAKARFEAGDGEGGAADVVDVLTFSRNLGNDGILVGTLVRYSLEQSADETIAPYLAGLKPDVLDRLADRLDRLPPGATLRESVRVERNFGQRWLIEQIRSSAKSGDWRKTLATMLDVPESDGNKGMSGDAMIQASGGTAEGVIAQLRNLDEYYDAVGPMLELPPAQFGERHAGLKAKVKDNPFAAAILPAFDRVYNQDARDRARQAMLRAAVAVARGGPDRLKDFRDPYGDGPFEYTARPGGFELRSKFVHDDKPVSLTVGGGKGGK